VVESPDVCVVAVVPLGSDDAADKLLAVVAVVAVAAFPVVLDAMVAGSRVKLRVPELILLALVVSVVADAASPVTLVAGTLFTANPIVLLGEPVTAIEAGESEL